MLKEELLIELDAIRDAEILKEIHNEKYPYCYIGSHIIIAAKYVEKAKQKNLKSA